MERDELTAEHGRYDLGAGCGEVARELRCVDVSTRQPPSQILKRIGNNFSLVLTNVDDRHLWLALSGG